MIDLMLESKVLKNISTRPLFVMSLGLILTTNVISVLKPLRNSRIAQLHVPMPETDFFESFPNFSTDFLSLGVIAEDFALEGIPITFTEGIKASPLSIDLWLGIFDNGAHARISVIGFILKVVHHLFPEAQQVFRFIHGE